MRASGLIAALFACMVAALPAHTATRATGSLQLSAELQIVSQLGDCPSGISANTCAARSGNGLVAGLGKVSETYTFVADVESPPCGAGLGRALAYPVTLTVADKGEIHLALAAGEKCVDQEAVRTQTQSFTITGGTGIYAGASGTGTVERVLGGVTDRGRLGRETWNGTLIVPGLEFDVTAPTLAGAVAKTVHAARGARTARVKFTVTATDDMDGALGVACSPRSGTAFQLGKTGVACTATDRSGNTSAARFIVTVKAKR
jgi:hypothetical protein